LRGLSLIDLDRGVDLRHEKVRGEEADGAGDDPDCERNEKRVAKVEQARHELGDLELVDYGSKLLKEISRKKLNL
jgi:hypothetical protein